MRGASLVELLVAMLIGAILLTGLVQIAAGARSSFRLQEALAEVQESGRFAIDTLGGILRQSAFVPDPWVEDLAFVGLTRETGDDINQHGDRLAVRTWSDRNCFGNPNPVAGNAGLPEFYLRETVIELNDAGSLIQSCRYGPGGGPSVTQLRRQGLVQNVDGFEVLYAEDQDGDRKPDRWVPAGQWQSERQVVGLQLAILLSSHESVTEPVPQVYNLLDKVVRAPADGKLRRTFTYVQALRGLRP